MELDSKIYVAGHRGLVGSAILAKLKQLGYSDLILKKHAELDLANQKQVEDFFRTHKPDYVFLAAAQVGGILANSSYPAEFIYNNLMISANVIHASYKHGVRKLLNLGSSCIYPKFAPQPMREEHLLTGKLEPTNEAYAMAKIAAIKMCRFYNQQYKTNFISVMPTNLYGPYDNFDLKTGHAMPAMIRKFSEAKDKVFLWGTGKPRREFLYVGDLAEAVIFLMQKYDYSEIGEFVNVGTGEDITIRQLAELIAKTVGFRGQIEWDPSKPDGTPQKLLDVSKIHGLGWKHKTTLQEGIKKTHKWFLENG